MEFTPYPTTSNRRGWEQFSLPVQPVFARWEDLIACGAQKVLAKPLHKAQVQGVQKVKLFSGGPSSSVSTSKENSQLSVRSISFGAKTEKRENFQL